MCITSLKVNMLGGLSIRSGDVEINDGDNRSRKVWLLLAYMIYCRKRPITQEELVRLLWDDADSVTNPANALKTMFHPGPAGGLRRTRPHRPPGGQLRLELQGPPHPGCGGV